MMASQSLFALVAISTIFFLTTMALRVTAAVVEHTFVVSQINMTHLCKKTPVTVVNGQLPGPTIEVMEGDSVIVHLINTHGVKQRRNCWNDGVPNITQPPIQPGNNFTYRLNLVGQEGTLWWHAHVPCLRATLHGAIIIRPRNGVASYPFPKPHKEVPIIIGDWWEMDLARVGSNMMNGIPEEGYVLDVEPGKTYLLRLINSGLFSEFYLKIAGHKFTVVGADANYVTPFTTDVIAIAPGETVDALMVADAPPGRYYMVALPTQAPLPDTQTPEHSTRGMVRYMTNHVTEEGQSGVSRDVPVAPAMPGQHDTITSLYFHGNMTSCHYRRHPPVPKEVNEHMYIVLGLGAFCPRGRTCEKGAMDSSNNLLVATMNNVSFNPPETVTPLLEGHYYKTGIINRTTQKLPDRPPILYNFTDIALIPFGPKERKLEQSSRATMVRRFRHGSVVEVVFQSSAMLQDNVNQDLYSLLQTSILGSKLNQTKMQETVKRRSGSVPMAAAAAIIMFLSAMACSVGAAVVKHTFVVSQVNMTHLCKETLVTLVNGQLPGPAIEVTEGSSVAVLLVNKSPYNLTIHWLVREVFGVIALSSTYIRYWNILKLHLVYGIHENATGRRCEKLWHHLVLVNDADDLTGDWWQLDLQQVERKMKLGFFDYFASASTINGKLGDLFNCSGVVEDSFMLDVVPGKTYMLRVINAGLFSEFYLKIAGHKFTVVAADANYVNPYTTDVIAIAPGETVDALVVADAPPGSYYMVALPNQAPLPDTQTPEYATRGIVKYRNYHSSAIDVPIVPVMPDHHDTITSFYFRRNLTSLHHHTVPQRVDESLFIVLGLGSICRHGQQSCKRGANNDTILVATMNNVSFQYPMVTKPLLEAHYYHTGGNDAMQQLPDGPPRMFNFTDQALIPFGPKEMELEPSSKATVVRRFRYGAVVDMVFQSTAVLQGVWFMHCHYEFHLTMGMAAVFIVEDGATVHASLPPPPADFPRYCVYGDDLLPDELCLQTNAHSS
ncbi:hypothetical protein HU200_049037 [Digitaria exilis]|uniref:laccase n=1 Tax=Digitaria exilis TaxID=1010633 RepID=A0A835ECD6_9POAL|nr:hypothetical protein HU200_049037 [Digitaria exilis]